MSSPLDTYRRSMTEAEMEQAIRDLATVRGGRVFHLRDARNSPELTDLPDLIVISAPVLAVVELKSHRRQVTAGQAEVMAMLAACTRTVTGIVRPEPRPGELSFDGLLQLLGEPGS